METRYGSTPPEDLNGSSPQSAGREPQNDALLRIRSQVSRAVGPDRFDRYFAKQAVMNVDGTRLDVTVPTKFMAEFIDRRFGQALRSAVREVLAPGEEDRAEESRLNFRVDSTAFGRAPQAPTEAATPAASVERPAPRRATALSNTRADAERLARYSLDTFVVGLSNRMAHAGAVGIAEEHGPAALHRLFIQGECGLGKTHLLRGIVARFKQLRPHARVRYATGEEFTNEFIAAVKSNSIEAFRRSFRRIDLLCLDDAHFLAGKDKTQTELLHTFDALDLDGARIVLASDEHPRDIRQLSEQLVSRFMAAGVVRIEPPEPELRERIVRAIALRRGIRIDEPALRLLVERAGGRHGAKPSVRDFEGALTQAEALVRVAGGAATPSIVTVGTVRRAMGLDEASTPARSSRPLPFQLVISEVCRELGVSPEDFSGRGRHKRVVLARSMCAFLGRSLTTLSYPEMARLMGRPTHSTLIMACARVRERLDDGKDPGLREELGPDAGDLTLRGLCDRLRGVVIRAAERGTPMNDRSGPPMPSGR